MTFRDLGVSRRAFVQWLSSIGFGVVIVSNRGSCGNDGVEDRYVIINGWVLTKEEALLRQVEFVEKNPENVV